jgi:hypothetical protein
MFVYDEAAHRRLAGERIERLAADYARANAGRRRLRLRWDLLLTAGMHLVERARPATKVSAPGVS